MSPARIEEFLTTCGQSWLGGQREAVRRAISAAVEEEAHLTLKTIMPFPRCYCWICEEYRARFKEGKK